MHNMCVDWHNEFDTTPLGVVIPFLPLAYGWCDNHDVVDFENFVYFNATIGLIILKKEINTNNSITSSNKQEILEGQLGGNSILIHI